MNALRRALNRLQCQRSTFSGALSLCSPQQAAHALSSDGLAALEPADSLEITVREQSPLPQASPADSASPSGSNKGSCASWRHVSGIKGGMHARQRHQSELRRPAGSSSAPWQVQCRSFSAQALPSKQSDEAEPLGFVRGGYSVEQFPPDKVCESRRDPQTVQTTAAMSLLSRAPATCVQDTLGYAAFAAADAQIHHRLHACRPGGSPGRSRWHVTPWHACNR